MDSRVVFGFGVFVLVTGGDIEDEIIFVEGVDNKCDVIAVFENATFKVTDCVLDIGDVFIVLIMKVVPKFKKMYI